MARPEAWRLDLAAYPHRVTIQTRFQDLDPLGHINNVAFSALFETARVRFNHALGMADWRGHRWLVAQVLVNYLAEGYHPADVEIGNGIGRIGTRSWTVMAGAFQNGRAVATCNAVLVMEAKTGVDSLPEGFRDQLERFRVRER